MDRDEALKLLKGGPEGIAEWNRRRQASEQIPDLRETDLRGASMIEANLNDADLSGADLRDADLTRANLNSANLGRSQLSRASLMWASLIDARLEGANLNGTGLRGANLIRTRLNDANLSGARCILTVFTNIDLSEIQGLDSIQHLGPSTIGLSTLFRSKGQIPEVFLRGCGVPEAVIIRLPDLVHLVGPIQFYSCFISYSSKNGDFAERLHADLQAKGVRTWFDRKDLKIGDKIRPRIDEAIRVHEKLMIVLSDQSIASDWVEGEVEAAAGGTGSEGEKRSRARFPDPARPCSSVTKARPHGPLISGANPPRCQRLPGWENSRRE